MDGYLMQNLRLTKPTDRQMLNRDIPIETATHWGSPILARHILGRKDSQVPTLAAAFAGLYLALERSLWHFKLEIGKKTCPASGCRPVSFFQMCKLYSLRNEDVSPPLTRRRHRFLLDHRHYCIYTAASWVAPRHLPKPCCHCRSVVFFIITSLHPFGRPARSDGPPRPPQVPRLGGGAVARRHILLCGISTSLNVFLFVVFI